MSAERDPGYREAIERPLAPAAPTGALLAPSAADEAALDRLRASERNRAYGMGIGAMILFRWVAPLLAGVPYLPGVVMLGAVVLLLYAIASFSSPRGIGPAVVLLSPEREVVAGHHLDVAVIVRPRARLELDPLIVRLVARRPDGGGEQVYESRHVLAERQVVEANRAVRLETSFPIPEDAPVTSPELPIRWRVEVAIGAPPIFRRSVVLRVRPATRRRRSDGEPRRLRAPLG